MSKYYVNRNAQDNGDHEVHVPTCSFFPESENRLYLGEFASCRPAVTEAQKTYPQSHGCYYCCTACHTDPRGHAITRKLDDSASLVFTVEYEREADDRWLAEVVELPGVLAYGQSSEEAIAKAQALALRVLADRLEHAEGPPPFMSITFAAA